MKPKCLIYGTALIGGLVFFALGCNKDKTTNKKVSEFLTREVKTSIELPSKKRQGEVETLEVVFTATINKETGELVSRRVSKNLLNYLGLRSSKDFDKFVGRQIFENSPKTSAYYDYATGTTFYDEEWEGWSKDDQDQETLDMLSQSNSSHDKYYSIKSCIEDCKIRYTDEKGRKLKGRGWCKFYC